MNLEIKSIKDKLKKILIKKDVLDVILFGSSVKGKILPGDIDIAIVSENDIDQNLLKLEGFHFSVLKPLDFFKKRVTLLNTLFREGYSLKYDKSFSECYGFKNRVLFIYELKKLNDSKKVKVVNVLRGKKGRKGLVVESNGEWLANQVFVVPVNNEYIFERFFVNFGINFKKNYILIH